jgi:hypothetical protein
MTAYCENAIKPIRLVGQDKIQFQVWHTGQVLVKPIVEIDGLDFETIRKLKTESKRFNQWHQRNA